MNMPTSRLATFKAFATPYILVGIVAIIFVAILIRDAGLYPHVFADEYVYSKFSRLMPLSLSEISNYLYLSTYRITNICGDGFLSCARILNALFFLAASPFIYFTAKRVTSKSKAILILVTALIGPINTYTAYFMPEAMYFFGFWVMTWWVLGIQEFQKTSSWVVTGALVAICSLIKPHGLFLLVPLSLYILALVGQKSLSITDGFRVIFLLILVTGITKLTLGFLLAGKAGLTIFGSTYESTVYDFFKSAAQMVLSSNSTLATGSEISQASGAAAESTVERARSVSRLLYLIATNFYGQVLGVSLLLGFSIVVAFSNLLISTSDRSSLNLTLKRYSIFALAILASLMLAAAFFSGFSVYTYGGEIYRLQARYYNFVFPLFFMVAISCCPMTLKPATRSGRLPFALLVSGFILAGLITSLNPYLPTVIDTPELLGLYQYRLFFYLYALILVLLIIYWVWRPGESVNIYGKIILPIFIIGITCVANYNLRFKMVADQYDHVGLIAKHYLSQSEISNLVVVGDNPIELSRILFYLDDPRASIQKIGTHTEYIQEQLTASGKSIALVMSGHRISEEIENQRHFEQFSVVGGRGAREINFGLLNWHPSELSMAEGLSLPPEVWGAWSTGRSVKLIFKKSLPRKYTMTLQARAFGSNANENFVFRSLGFQKLFTVTSNFEDVTINVDGFEGGNWIEIDIPHPQSPQSINQGNDTRHLGIGIKKIAIEW